MNPTFTEIQELCQAVESGLIRGQRVTYCEARIIAREATVLLVATVEASAAIRRLPTAESLLATDFADSITAEAHAVWPVEIESLQWTFDDERK